jgi:hypothetical protein
MSAQSPLEKRTRNRLRGLLAVSVALMWIGGEVAVLVYAPTWARIHGTVTGVEPECEMVAQGYYRHFRPTFDIDCGQLEEFKVAHADKTWSVYHVNLVHFRLNTPQRTDTTLLMGDTPKAGDVRELFQDPSDPAHVMANRTDLPLAPISAAILAVGAALLVVYGVLMVRRWRSRRAPAGPAFGGR